MIPACNCPAKIVLFRRDHAFVRDTERDGRTNTTNPPRHAYAKLGAVTYNISKFVNDDMDDAKTQTVRKTMGCTAVVSLSTKFG